MTEQIELMITNISDSKIVILDRMLPPGRVEFFMEEELVNNTHIYQMEEEGKIKITLVNKGIPAATYTEMQESSSGFPTKIMAWLTQNKNSLVRAIVFFRTHEDYLDKKIIYDYDGSTGIEDNNALTRTTVYQYDQVGGFKTSKQKIIYM